jgi:probable F420-dependent oxidoreductase
MSFEFAITFKPDMPVERILALTRQAEAGGFHYGWMFDSHVLWQEPYPLLTLMGANTERMRFGTCVTNPGVRDATVTASLLATMNRITAGRMDLGIGRGDSSRRVMGKRPLTLERLEETVNVVKSLCAGDKVNYEGRDLEFNWTTKDVPPVWIAGYGPKALRCAGRAGDGVILQFADPDLIRWCLGYVKEGCEEAGKDFSQFRVMAAAPAWISSDLLKARDQVRWFPALVSNHVVDLIAKYGMDELPGALTDYVKNRKGYDYLHHAEVGSSNAEFVTDEIVDRFALVGTADEHIRRLNELKEIGVTQFNIYLMSGEEEEQLALFAKEVVPHFR